MTVNFQKQAEVIKGDPSVSVWLKKAISELEQRDPVDAMNDAELLLHLMNLRFKEIAENHG